jgi:hypothetical protein
VRWTYQGDPGTLTACNCGFCRRAAALWAYGSVLDIHIEGETVAYLRGDRMLAFHHCPACGATTHWASVLPPGAEGHGRRAVNMRLADPALVARLPVKRLDGADTWRSLEPGEQAGVPFLPF